MDSQSSSNWISKPLAAILAGAMLIALSSCGKNAVRASEKEFLADRIMRFDSDRHEAAADSHVISNREGANGGKGTGGGGCGCN